jgi:hypothetical protein
MANTCNSCGGNLNNIFSLAGTSSDNCSCNVGALVPMTSGGSSGGSSGGCCVESVNGQTGVVILDINDINLLGNQFFSAALVYAALSGTTPIAFNSSTGNISHANSGVTAGTYGNSSVYPIVTVDAKGHVTNVQTQALPNLTLPTSLTNLSALSGTGYPVLTGVNTWALRNIIGTAGRIGVTNQNGVAGNTQVDLAASGVTAGTYGGGSSYPVIQVDSYGRITSATSQSLSPVVIPAHTHSLGSLSNVNPLVDTTAILNDVLTWNGTSWVSAALPTPPASLLYEGTQPVITNGWAPCKSINDIDVPNLNGDLSVITKLEDSIGNSVTYLNFMLYKEFSSFTIQTSLPTADFYTLDEVGSLPYPYWPVHKTIIPLGSNLINGAMFGKAGSSSDPIYEFSEYQLGIKMNLIIHQDGLMQMGMEIPSNYTLVRDGGNRIILCPVVGSFLTQTIAT